MATGTLITTPFGFETTAAEVVEGVDLSGRRAVVTGGASASYGSDAVGGVVNFITDKKFEGIKANAQFGITTYGDDENALFQIAAGKSFLNDRLHVTGVLLTMYDPRSNLAREVADEVRKHFRVFDTVIPRNVRLAEAPSHGKPVILYDAGSRGSHGYLSLARELLGASSEAA